MATARLDQLAPRPRHARPRPRARAAWSRRERTVAAALVLAIAAVLALASPSEPRVSVLPAGAGLVASLTRTLTSEAASAGARVTLETREPLLIPGATTLPAGMRMHGEVTDAAGGGGEPATLAIRFDKVEIGGENFPIEAEPFRLVGGGKATGVLGTGVAVPTEGGYIVLGEGQRLRIRLARTADLRR